MRLNSMIAVLACLVLMVVAGCGEENKSVEPEPVTPVPVQGPSGVALGNNVSLAPLLTWRASGQPGDSVVYDVYFGTQTSPPRVATAIADTTFAVGPLFPGARYYWAVHVRINGGPTGKSQVWEFLTKTGITLPIAAGNRWEYRRFIEAQEATVSFHEIEVAQAGGTWGPLPAFVFEEHTADLSSGTIDSSWTYYHHADSGLFLLGYEGSCNATPTRRVVEYDYRFNGYEFDRIEDLLRLIRADFAVGVRSATASVGPIIEDPPKRAIEYPIEVGSRWTFRKGDPWPMEKEVLGYQVLTVPAGKFGAYEIRTYYDADNDGAWDDNFIRLDYFAEQGMVKRSITLLDLELRDPLGNLIVIVDVYITYELVAYEVE